MKFCLFLLPAVCIALAGYAQDNAPEKQLERAKAEMKQNAGEAKPDYVTAGKLLENVVQKLPGNAEGWYFYGYAIDRYNSYDGETIINVQLPLTIQASQAFEKSIQLSNDAYKGEILLLDPHTKILTVWGSQALKYLYDNQKDSALWCMEQAEQRGGINRISLNYFRQVMGECMKGAYLFTNGDMYLYYLLYLQMEERYRTDLYCIDLNLLNKKWYPDWLVRKNVFPLSFSPEELDKLDILRWDEQEVTIENKNNDYEDSAITWSLKPTVSNKFLIRSDRLLLDFLQQNAFEKPVFFAGDVPQEMYLFLNDYLQCRGLTYKLVTQKNSTDIAQLTARLKKLGTISSPSKTYLNNRDNIQLLNNYRFAYTTAATIATANKNNAVALQLIEASEKKYPESALPFFAEATKKWFTDFREKLINNQ